MKIPDGIANALFTLFGAAITAGSTYLAAVHTASITSRQSCIARLDTRESEIRQKSDRFITSVAMTATISSFRELDLKKVEDALTEVVKSGYSFSSYVDEDLSIKTQNLANIISQRLDMSSTRNTSPEFQGKLSDETRDGLKDYFSSLRHQLKELDTKRKEC